MSDLLLKDVFRESPVASQSSLGRWWPGAGTGAGAGHRHSGERATSLVSSLYIVVGSSGVCGCSVCKCKPKGTEKEPSGIIVPKSSPNKQLAGQSCPRFKIVSCVWNYIAQSSYVKFEQKLKLATTENVRALAAWIASMKTTVRQASVMGHIQGVV